MNQRLDEAMVAQKIVQSRSHAQRLIKLQKVLVNAKHVLKPSHIVSLSDVIKIVDNEDYVSRAAYKLASVASKLRIDFSGAVVLDVGSSTGGFTDYALQHGAKQVIAVDVGTGQLHPSLRANPNVELHEKTDIRDFTTTHRIDVVVIDVSFISLRHILPSVKRLAPKAIIFAMVKPQFEAQARNLNKGIVKNDRIRRDILKEFEQWVSTEFVLIDKADSDVAGERGNLERFYALKSKS